MNAKALYPLFATFVLVFAVTGCSKSENQTSTKSIALPPASAAWTEEVKIGRCTRLTKLEDAYLPESKAVGFEYVELSVQVLARLTEDEFEQAQQMLKEIGISTPVANGFIPRDIKLVGPEIDKQEQIAYVTKAFERVSRVGVKIIGFGSGPARSAPEGFDRDEAFEQLVEFGKRIGPEAEKYGVTVAVEPMRIEEANMINNVAQALEWVKAVNHRHFQLMVDYRHFVSENDDPAAILKAKDHIVHVHFANPKGPDGRPRYPKSVDEYNYGPFFEALQEINYTGGVSVEARERDWDEEAPAAVAFLRSQLKRG